ncbi:MAG: translation elongation factor EF-1 subunit alpha [Candidatus Geothermarchaeales archaeon]
MATDKPHMNLVIVGHVDHGKSTMMGHLLYKLGVIDQRAIDTYAKQAEETGTGATFKFAWVLDRLKEERERGLTIDLAFNRFETDKYYYTMIDAPGHRDFVKNMITGASQADAAILVVSAKKGEFEAGLSTGGQTREHAFLLLTLGVKQVVVAVNKMDDVTVDWSEERYNEVKDEVSDLMKVIGFDVASVPFVPVSGWTGDNLLEKGDRMKWYDGVTILAALNQFQQPEKPLDKPLRIPVQDVYSITGVGTVPVGRVETGVLKPGDQVVFMPSGKLADVKSIEMHHTEIDRAIPGDNIGFNVKGISRTEISRGDVAGPPGDPATIASEFIGQVIVIQHPTAITAGYTPVLHAHTAQVAVTFSELLAKINPRTGETTEEKPSFLKAGDSALVRFKPLRPMVIEEFAQFPEFGRFAVRDMGSTIAAGVVREITEKATPGR